MADARRQVVPQMQTTGETTAALLRELVAHLGQARTQLREEWARHITEARLLTAMSKDEIFAEATAVYDNYVDVLETRAVEALQAYARNLSERDALPLLDEAHGHRDRDSVGGGSMDQHPDLCFRCDDSRLLDGDHGKIPMGESLFCSGRVEGPE